MSAILNTTRGDHTSHWCRQYRWCWNNIVPHPTPNDMNVITYANSSTIFAASPLVTDSCYLLRLILLIIAFGLSYKVHEFMEIACNFTMVTKVFIVLTIIVIVGNCTKISIHLISNRSDTILSRIHIAICFCAANEDIDHV